MRNTSIRSIVEHLETSNDFTIFFVGDSLTEGFRATSDGNTYVAKVAQGLALRYPDKRMIRYDGKRHSSKDAELLPLFTYGDPIEIQNGSNGTVTVVRSGVGGNTVQRMLDRKNDFIGYELDGRKSDLFFINVGINDALITDPRKYVTSADFDKNLNLLLDEIEIGAPYADIILMTPTFNDLGDTPYSHLEPYADVMRSVAAKRSIPLIDLHKVWMDHLTVGGENFGQGDWLSGVKNDACHPSDAGHAAIAQAILDSLK